MVVITPDRILLARFSALRAELADLAFELECQGRRDAADITNQLRVRLTEFAGEIEISAAEVGGALRPDGLRVAPKAGA